MERVPTGIETLDRILGGGIPVGSLIILAGAPGTGKTILAQQICFANATSQHKAVYYTTLSEPHTKLIRHLEQFSWFDPAALGDRVDFIHLPDLVDREGLESFASEIARRAFESEPAVVVVDSSRALHDFTSPEHLRQTVYELASRVAHTNAVLLFVGEYGFSDLTDVPEFAVADGIIQVANEPTGSNDRRWLRVAKMRGAGHLAGKHTFVIGDGGVSVYPRFESDLPVRTERAEARVSTGVKGLDDMIEGGVPTGGATLVAGPAGAGKTVLGLHFIVEGLTRGERCVYISFQETEGQLIRKAKAFGWDLRKAVEEGRLALLNIRPVELSLDVTGSRLRAAASDNVSRIVIDSLAELHHAALGTDRFADFTWALVETFRSVGATTMLTSETAAFFGPVFELAEGVSFVVDNVVLLRYTELESEIRRALGVVKMRDSDHVKSLVEFEIGSSGVKLKGKFSGLAGVLTGTPVRTEERFKDFFNR